MNLEFYINGKKVNPKERDIEIEVGFPKPKPICCGKLMYPCGGLIGVRIDRKTGDIEHQWRCSICGKETMDILQ